MKYEQKLRIPSSEKTVVHFVASCIKCNNDDINISEYEDKYGFISTAICKNKNCKNEVKINACAADVITAWNEQNDIATTIANKTRLIEQTKVEIRKLKLLQRERRVKSKSKDL